MLNSIIRSPLPRRSLLLPRFHPSNSTKYSTSSKYNNKKGSEEAHPVISVNQHGSRSWLTYIVPAAGMGFVGLAAFVHYNDERRAVLKERRNFTEKNLGGNWTRLYFVNSTSSPDVMPEQQQIISKAIDILESRHNLKVLPVFVSIDPQVVNPSHLRAYLKELDPRIVGPSGPFVAVRKMVQKYRVYFKKIEEEGNDYLVDSSHKMYMFSPNLEVMMRFGIEHNAEELSQAILKVVQNTPQFFFFKKKLFQL